MARLLLDEALIRAEKQKNPHYGHVSDDLNQIATFIGHGYDTKMIRRWFRNHRPKSPYTNISAVLRVTHGAAEAQ